LFATAAGTIVHSRRRLRGTDGRLRFRRYVSVKPAKKK
jgi:hypothetical protein